MCVRGPRESTGAGRGPSWSRPGAAGAPGPTDRRAARWRPPLALAAGARGRWEMRGGRVPGVPSLTELPACVFLHSERGGGAAAGGTGLPRLRERAAARGV